MVKQITDLSTNIIQVNRLSSLDPDAVGHNFGDQVLRNNEGLIITHHSVPLCVVEARVRSSGHVIQGVLDSRLEIIAKAHLGGPWVANLV